MKRECKNYIKRKSRQRVANAKLTKENKKLKEQLEYIRSGEYFNQLRFERDMLQDVVDNGEVSKVDKEFIDMVHRNTELVKTNIELSKEIDLWMQKYNSQYEKNHYLVEVIEELKKQLPNSDIKNVIDKYKNQQKEIIGVVEDE